MQIFNEHGEEWINLPIYNENYSIEIAFFLKNYFPNKRALLIRPNVTEFSSLEIAKKLKVDVIFQDQSNHNVSLSTPKFMQNWDIPFYYLTSDYNYFFNPQPGLLFFPYWVIYCRKFIRHELEFGHESDINRNYLLSSITRHPRPHRIYNFIRLRKKAFFVKTYWTFYKCSHIDIVKNSWVTDSEWSEFEKFYLEQPAITTSEFGCIRDVNWDAYTNCYLNVTSETYAEYNYASEKSFKPFTTGQMPIIYGPNNANGFLEKIGFDMFTDIVDYYQFDNLKTVQERIDNMLNVIDDIAELNFKKIFKETAERRKKNKEHLFSDDLVRHLLVPFFKEMNKNGII